MYLSPRARARSLAHSLARAFLSFSTASFSTSLAPGGATPPPSPRSYQRRHYGTARHSLSCSFYSLLARLSTFFLSHAFLPSFSLRLTSTPCSCGYLSAPFSHTCDATHYTTMYTHVRTSLHNQFPVPMALRINSRSFLLFLRFALFGSYLRLPVYFSLRVSLPHSQQSPPHTPTTSPTRPTPSNRRVGSSHSLTDFSISILFSRIRRNITA